MVWTITYVIRDEKGKTSQMRINIPGTLDIATATEFALQFASLVDAAIKGVIVSAGISLSVNIAHLLPGDTPEANGDVEEKGYFQYLTDNGFRTTVTIPSLDEALVKENSNELNMLAPALVALNQAMVVGLVVFPGTPEQALVEPCDARGENITQLSTALEIFESSGRARR